MKLIDTHCHLNDEKLYQDLDNVISRALQTGVEKMIVPGWDKESSKLAIKIAEQYPFVYACVGVHPENIEGLDEKTLLEILNLYSHPKVVAIGEIGLDYYWDTTFKEAQQEVFRRQLALAQELDLPIMIHNREATEDTLRILREYSAISSQHSALRGVVHCFNGSKEVATEILNMGLYLGIGGVLTFKNCKLAEMLKELNTEYRIQSTDLISRIVLETDGPYLAPTPHRGERNESRLMIHVAERLAQVFDMTTEQIIAITSSNAEQLFHLKNV